MFAFLLLPLPSAAQSSISRYTISARELSIPDKAHRAFEKGALLLLQNNAAESLTQFQSAISTFPRYYEAYYEMGVADLRLWRLSDAETSFQKSVDLSGGQFVQPLFGLGAVFVYQKKFQEAEEITRRGLSLESNSWAGHCYLGWALFGLNRLEEAELNVREALRLKADSLESLRLLVDIHSRQKDYRALLEDLDQYLRLDPDSAIATRARSLRATAERLLQSPNTTAQAEPQP